MRLCNECKHHRWEGKKLEGKFTCAECLAKKLEVKKPEVEEDKEEKE